MAGRSLGPAEAAMQGLQEPGFPGDSRKLSQGFWDVTVAEGGQGGLDLHHMCKGGESSKWPEGAMSVEHLMKAIDHLSAPLRLGEIT